MIYFIRDTATGLVKIGFSENPWLRIVNMQSGCPGELRVAALLEGGRGEEAALHREYAAHRVRGEWFRPAGALEAFLATAAEVTDPSSSPRTSGHADLVRRLANATGASHRTVAAWITRGRIPGGYMLAIDRAGIIALSSLVDAVDASRGRVKAPHAALLRQAIAA